jgi:hypothetical protein
MSRLLHHPTRYRTLRTRKSHIHQLYDMSNKSGTARFKRSAALDLTDENHPQEISTIIADHVWSGLNWPSQHSLPFDPQCRRVVTRETDPAYRNILNVLVCPARTDSAQSRHIIEQAWNDGDVVHVPWLLRGDGTLVLSPPYITGICHPIYYDVENSD